MTIWNSTVLFQMCLILLAIATCLWTWTFRRFLNVCLERSKLFLGIYVKVKLYGHLLGLKQSLAIAAAWASWRRLPWPWGATGPPILQSLSAAPRRSAALRLGKCPYSSFLNMKV